MNLLKLCIKKLNSFQNTCIVFIILLKIFVAVCFYRMFFILQIKIDNILSKIYWINNIYISTKLEHKSL